MISIQIGQIIETSIRVNQLFMEFSNRVLTTDVKEEDGHWEDAPHLPVDRSRQGGGEGQNDRHDQGPGASLLTEVFICH